MKCAKCDRSIYSVNPLMSKGISENAAYECLGCGELVCCACCTGIALLKVRLSQQSLQDAFSNPTCPLCGASVRLMTTRDEEWHREQQEGTRLKSAFGFAFFFGFIGLIISGKVNNVAPAILGVILGIVIGIFSGAPEKKKKGYSKAQGS